ncbi:hypothetical protein [Deinococcus sp. Marseille-Q6407]|nr:hypothetical protein [Deinococcus sp. Marseille-Q6407]
MIVDGEDVDGDADLSGWLSGWLHDVVADARTEDNVPPPGGST